MRYKISRPVNFGALGQDATTDTSGTGTTSSTPDWLTSLIGAGTQIENVAAQQQLNTINIQRASQGLAPLPSSVVGPTATVGLSSDTQNLLLVLGLGAGALLLFSMILKR